jgi:hypothetical protein
MTPDIFFGAGDRAPSHSQPLIGPDGNPIDGTAKTLIFRYRLTDQTAPEVRDTASWSGSPTLGIGLWVPSAPMPAGTYHANWIVQYGLSDQMTIPNDRWLIMVVKPVP